MVEQQPSKLNTRVRFPSPAPALPASGSCVTTQLRFAVVHEDVAQVVRPGPREFIPGLAIARGIAALMVALFHSGQSTYFNAAGRALPLIGATQHNESHFAASILLRSLGNGHGAVIFFFVLSGFVLTMMLQRLSPEMAPSARSFFIGRVLPHLSRHRNDAAAVYGCVPADRPIDGAVR